MGQERLWQFSAHILAPLNLLPQQEHVLQKWVWNLERIAGAWGEVSLELELDHRVRSTPAQTNYRQSSQHHSLLLFVLRVSPRFCLRPSRWEAYVENCGFVKVVLGALFNTLAVSAIPVLLQMERKT